MNVAPSNCHEHPHVSQADLARIVLVGLAAMLAWAQPLGIRHHPVLFGWVAIGAGGWPILAEALGSLREGRMTMELSMTLALVCAAAIGEFVTALLITAFVLAAEVLEGLTVGHGRRAIGDLLDVLPPTVQVRFGPGWESRRLEDLALGEVVLVNPGGRLAADGVVVAGHSFVDESAITGEPLPAEKLPGSKVHAGTINQSGALDVQVERLGRETAFGRIIQAVEEAEHSRAPIQKWADRLAGWLVHFALGCAALTWVFTRDLRSTISVVVVAGACGIAAGTPLAILGAIGRSARLGAIVKGGLSLETLSRVDTLVFDKTGTLTEGKAEVTAVLPEPGQSAGDLLALAAMAEARSEHPVAQAIVRHARGRAHGILEPDRFRALPGRGVEAWGPMGRVLVGNRGFLLGEGAPVSGRGDESGATEVLVAREGVLVGRIQVADRPRAQALAAVRAMRGMGYRLVLLTGDTAGAANAIGRGLGIDQVEGDLLPTDKQARIAAMKREGQWVAMLGDGINDSPAMVEAQVGIAMGSGADVARETADVVLIGNDLNKFVEVLRLARRMRRIILQNFVGTLAVDGIGMGMAAFGLLNPLSAALIHVASEMAFILNAARLLPSGPGQNALPNENDFYLEHK